MVAALPPRNAGRPVRGIFDPVELTGDNNQEVVSVFDASVLFAMIIYVLLAAGVPPTTTDSASLEDHRSGPARRGSVRPTDQQLETPPMSPRTLATRAALVGAIVAALLFLPALASGAGQPEPTTTTSTTVAPTTTIVEPEPEPELEPGPSVSTVVGSDALPDAEAADADAVAGQPTFTG